MRRALSTALKVRNFWTFNRTQDGEKWTARGSVGPDARGGCQRTIAKGTVVVGAAFIGSVGDKEDYLSTVLGGRMTAKGSSDLVWSNESLPCLHWERRTAVRARLGSCRTEVSS